MEVLFLNLSAFNTLSRLCFSTLATLTLAQGAERERALTSDSDTRGTSEERGRRGAVLICLLTWSMLPIVNTVEAGMHRGREGSAHRAVKEHTGPRAASSTLHYIQITLHTWTASEGVQELVGGCGSF